MIWRVQFCTGSALYSITSLKYYMKQQKNNIYLILLGFAFNKIESSSFLCRCYENHNAALYFKSQPRNMSLEPLERLGFANPYQKRLMEHPT